MRSHLRTIIVLALAAGLLVLFFYNVDLLGVAREITRAHPGWLALSLATMLINLSIRAWRWQYLIEPLGEISFASSFRATAVGFAASAVLPARAGEVIRPYFLSRHEPVSATGAFATIILERVLDMLTVLTLLAVYVFGVRPTMPADSALAYAAVKWAAGIATAGSFGVFIVLFLLARNPARLAETLQRLERVLPSALAGLLARVAEKFATGLGVIRRPGRLFVALLLSLPLWLSIAAGIWACAAAFHLTMPFAGAFLAIAILVVGVAFPTPGAVGGFHEAFRVCATTFFGASDQAAVAAAIVLHLFTTVPVLLIGLLFAAHEGLNIAGMKRIAERERPSEVAPT
jgi:uncharacterized protein (TIRG00374 family)